MALPPRPSLNFAALFAFLTLFLFSSFVTSASADQLSGNPGDAFVFAGESPVAPDGTSQQGGPSISGILVFWTENDTGAQKTRVFFKDLSLGEAEPGHALIEEQTSASTPVVNLSGNRVVWSEMVGAELHLYYKDQGPDGFESCSGTSDECATPLAPGYYWQENPSISPDGSKVAWEYGRSHDSQIHLYDFNTGIEEELYGMPGGDQQFPSVGNEWVVWEDNRDFNSLSFPLDQHIYARHIGSFDPPISIADNGHSAHASVGPAKVTRNQNNEPVVFYLSSIEDRYGHDIYTAHLYNLSNGTDQTIDEITGQPQNPSIDGDKIVWEDCSENPFCNVVLHDLSTGGTQVISQDPDLGARNPKVSASSGYIVWLTSHLSPTTVYYNQMGERAQTLAETYAPHLHLHSQEYFQPRNVGIFIGGEGTSLMKRSINGASSLFEWPNLTLDLLGQYSSDNDQPGNLAEGKFLDLPGNTWWAWEFPSEWFLRRDFVYRYNELASKPEYPELYYARVTKNPNSDRFAIQYWIPYYFNNFGNYHEGDWELVQVDLDNNFQATGAAFTQHTGATKRLWDFMDCEDTHPVVYVGKGSHASYFAPGDYNVQVNNLPDKTDYAETNENEAIHEPLVEVLPDVSTSDLGNLVGGPFGWLAYQGAWGEILGITGFDGPQGPAASPEHGATWDDPFTWYDGLCWAGSDTCNEELRGVSGSSHSPVDIHLYDAQGRHVGKNEAGSIDEQIPGSEYIEIPALHEKTITVHGGDGLDSYRFVLTGTGAGTFDFTVSSADHDDNSSDIVRYQAVPVTASAEASVLLDEQKNYALTIDADGDGTVDEERQPDSLVTKEIDLTPPERTADLSVVNTTSDSIELNFTAPGDDESAGTAQYYDIRYGTEPITADNWNEAMPLAEVPIPSTAGSTETAVVNDLLAGTTYYLALVAKDEAAQSSPLSNVVQTSTTIPELTWSILRVYWASWDDYINRRLSVDYRMSNNGTATAFESTVQASLCTTDTVYAVTELPLTVGDINSGGHEDLTLKYYIPTGVGSFITQTHATCSDDAGREYWFPEPLS